VCGSNELNPIAMRNLSRHGKAFSSSKIDHGLIIKDRPWYLLLGLELEIIEPCCEQDYHICSSHLTKHLCFKFVARERTSRSCTR